MFPAALSDRKILLIDDNSDTRNIITQVLLSEGYSVYAVNTSSKAIEFVESRQPLLAILIDPRMPCTDGWQLVTTLKQSPQSSSIPMMVMSGNRRNEQKALCLGATAYLAKPLDIDLLLDTLCLMTTQIVV